MHVELVEIKKRNDERKVTKKPFVYKEIDFPSISSERKRNLGIKIVKLKLSVRNCIIF